VSYARGMAAIRLQAPAEIPHTQYISHLGFMSKITGLAADHPDLGRSAAEVLDFDFIWSTDGPNPPGRWTDMGRAYWHERQQEADSRHLGFADVEEALNLDPRQEYGLPDLD